MVLPFCISASECQKLSVKIHESDFLQLSLAAPNREFLSTDVAQFCKL